MYWISFFTLFSRSEERVDERLSDVGVSSRRHALAVMSLRRLTRSLLRSTTLSTASRKEGS
jgi:hypothetical protein